MLTIVVLGLVGCENKRVALTCMRGLRPGSVKVKNIHTCKDLYGRGIVWHDRVAVGLDDSKCMLIDREDKVW